MNIQTLIPLYLTNQLTLSEATGLAIQPLSEPHSQSQSTKTKKESRKQFLTTILTTAKSLPRTTDTWPNTPEPDLPSAAQGRLLDLVRAVYYNCGLYGQVNGNGGTNGNRWVQEGDLLGLGFGDSNGNFNGYSNGYGGSQSQAFFEEEDESREEEEEVFWEVYNLIKRVLGDTFPSPEVPGEIEEGETEGEGEWYGDGVEVVDTPFKAPEETEREMGTGTETDGQWTYSESEYSDTEAEAEPWAETGRERAKEPEIHTRELSYLTPGARESEPEPVPDLYSRNRKADRKGKGKAKGRRWKGKGKALSIQVHKPRIHFHLPNRLSRRRTRTRTRTRWRNMTGIGGGVGVGAQHKRRKRSRRRRAEETQYIHLISFLAFLTKEGLLPYPLNSMPIPNQSSGYGSTNPFAKGPSTSISASERKGQWIGVGEKIALEMISEILAHPSNHQPLSQPQSQSQSQSSSYYQYSSQSTSHTRVDSGVQLQNKPDEATEDDDEADRSLKIQAASLWLIIMGEELYERVRVVRPKTTNPFRDNTSTGTGSPGPGVGVTDAIWETWITRLQFLSLREDLDIEAREGASEAAAVMRRVF